MDAVKPVSLEKSISDMIKGVPWERLYRLEVQRKIEKPVASAPESRFTQAGWLRPSFYWQRVALIYDVHDKTHEQLVELVVDAVEDEAAGQLRVVAYAWEGQMMTPEAGRLMGKGEDFLYSSNPRGNTIVKFDEAIEFDIHESDD